MSAEQPKKNDRRQALALPAAVLVITAGFVAWWLLQDPVKVPEPSAPVAAVQVRPTPSGAVSPAAAYEDKHVYALPIHPAGSASATEPVHPHPFTPQHERIFRENHLIGQLNGAMDIRDAKGMRQLLATYREEYPEDENVMQDGYQLVINCIESPGEATRAAAKKYWETELASGLRRSIRRHCLEWGQTP